MGPQDIAAMEKEMEELEYDRPPLFKFEIDGEFVVGKITEEMHVVTGQSWDSLVMTLEVITHNKGEAFTAPVCEVACGVMLKRRVEAEKLRVGDVIGVKFMRETLGESQKYKEILLLVFEKVPRPEGESSDGPNGKGTDDISY